MTVRPSKKSNLTVDEDPQVLDFTGVARGSHVVKTYVGVFDDDARAVSWLKLGEIKLMRHEALHHWTLDAPACEDIWENGDDPDGVFLVRLVLVGVSFQGVFLGGTHLQGWINAINPEDFRVPSTTLIGHKAPYVPEPNPKLWERLKGRRVSIFIKAQYAK